MAYQDPYGPSDPQSDPALGQGSVWGRGPVDASFGAGGNPVYGVSPYGLTMFAPPERLPLLRIPFRLWFQSMFTAVLSYGAAVLLAVVMLVWSALASNVSDSAPESDPSDAPVDDSAWSILFLPLQFVSMATFGILRMASGIDSSSPTATPIDMRFAIPVLLLTVLMVRIIVARTRSLAKRFQVTMPGALALAVVTAGAFSALVSGVAMALPVKLDDVDPDQVVSIGSGGVDALIGAFVLAFGFSLITWIVRAGLWSTWVQRYPVLSNGSLRVATVHVGLLVTVCAVLAVVAVTNLVDNGGALPLGIVGMVNLGGLLVIFSSLGSFTVEAVGLAKPLLSTTALGRAPEFYGSHDLLGMEDPGILAWTPALALLLSIFAAVLLAARRVSSRPTLSSWGITAISYGLVGLVLQVALTARFAIYYRMANKPAGEASVIPAVWTFAVFIGWGLFVELLARFVFQRPVGRLSPGMLRRIQRISGVDYVRPATTVTRPIDYGQPIVPETSGTYGALPDVGASSGNGTLPDYGAGPASGVPGYGPAQTNGATAYGAGPAYENDGYGVAPDYRGGQPRRWEQPMPDVGTKADKGDRFKRRSD